MSIRALFVVGLASMSLTACGGSGTLALELTDAPPDLTSLDHVYVTLDAVEVHVADADEDKDGDPADTSIDKDDGWHVVAEHAGRFDLLALQNDVTSPLGEVEAPSGKITQIRLHIDEAGENKVVLKTGEECAFDLSDVNKNGIKINHPFKAIELPEDEQLRVVVDFDLKESVDQTGSCSFKLKPVIKIKKIEQNDEAKAKDE